MWSKLLGLISPFIQLVTKFFSPKVTTTRSIRKLRRLRNKALIDLERAISEGNDSKVRYYSSMVKRLNEEINQLYDDRKYL